MEVKDSAAWTDYLELKQRVITTIGSFAQLHNDYISTQIKALPEDQKVTGTLLDKWCLEWHDQQLDLEIQNGQSWNCRECTADNEHVLKRCGACNQHRLPKSMLDIVQAKFDMFAKRVLMNDQEKQRFDENVKQAFPMPQPKPFVSRKKRTKLKAAAAAAE